MKLHTILTYPEFVEYERPYYPLVADGTLLIADFAVNDHITGQSAKNRLIVTDRAVVNLRSFAAVYNCIISCNGLRERWFYFDCARRVSWNELSWDRKHDVVYAFRRNLERGSLWAEARPPTRKIVSYYTQLERMGWL